MPGAASGVTSSTGRPWAPRALAGPVPRRRFAAWLLLCGPLCSLLLSPARAADLKREAAGHSTRDARDAHPGGLPRSERPRASAEEDLSRARLAYERGDYGAVIQLLRPLLYPTALLPDEDQVVAAHKLLAMSHFFEHDLSSAEGEFSLLLSLRPDFTLDPLVEPKNAVAFLDTLRQRNTEHLSEVRRRQATEEEVQRKKADARLREQAPKIYIERVVRRQSTALCLVPFGVPQLVTHRRVPGALLLVGEGLTGVGSLATWLAVRLRYPDSTFPPRELGTARALTATYLTTGALFWGLILTGVVDAFLHQKTVVEVHELPGPPKDFKTRPRTTLRLAPFFAPGAPGPAPAFSAGLGGTF